MCIVFNKYWPEKVDNAIIYLIQFNWANNLNNIDYLYVESWLQLSA